jgi:hypothetical protein
VKKKGKNEKNKMDIDHSKGHDKHKRPGFAVGSVNIKQKTRRMASRDHVE